MIPLWLSRWFALEFNITADNFITKKKRRNEQQRSFINVARRQKMQEKFDWLIADEVKTPG